MYMYASVTLYVSVDAAGRGRVSACLLDLRSARDLQSFNPACLPARRMQSLVGDGLEVERE